jgi:hypothetical protein
MTACSHCVGTRERGRRCEICHEQHHIKTGTVCRIGY